MRAAATSAAVLLLATLAPAAGSAGHDPQRGDAAGPGTRTVLAVARPDGDVVRRGPGAGLVQAQVGAPALKPGFPVDVLFTGGSYQCCASGVLVGDVDGDPDLEILASGIARGTTTAVDPDGSVLPGWPDADTGRPRGNGSSIS